MEKSGPRLTANRKQQKALLSLLRELRMQAGLRQVDMARALGKPQAFVSYYESGARRLDLLELRQICGILGVPSLTSSGSSRSFWCRIYFSRRSSSIFSQGVRNITVGEATVHRKAETRKSGGGSAHFLIQLI